MIKRIQEEYLHKIAPLLPILSAARKEYDSYIAPIKRRVLFYVLSITLTIPMVMLCIFEAGFNRGKSMPLDDPYFYYAFCSYIAVTVIFLCGAPIDSITNDIHQAPQTILNAPKSYILKKVIALLFTNIRTFVLPIFVLLSIRYLGYSNTPFIDSILEESLQLIYIATVVAFTLATMAFAFSAFFKKSFWANTTWLAVHIFSGCFTLVLLGLSRININPFFVSLFGLSIETIRATIAPYNYPGILWLPIVSLSGLSLFFLIVGFIFINRRIKHMTPAA